MVTTVVGRELAHPVGSTVLWKGLGSSDVWGPGLAVGGEAEVEQPAQVEGGGAGVDPPVVRCDAAVGHSAAASADSDQPGDGSFDHGPVLSVGVAQVGVGGPGSASRAQDRVVGVQVQRPAVSGCGALRPQGAAEAASTEDDMTSRADATGMSA